MKEELNMSVSAVMRRDGKQYASVLFSDGEREAEAEIPACKVVRNQGFEEEEIVALEFYMKTNLASLKEMAQNVNVMKAFMK